MLLTESAGVRTAPEFVESLMELPVGWVTEPINNLTLSQQIAALGNGVVPLQAVAALQPLSAEQTDDASCRCGPAYAMSNGARNVHASARWHSLA